jgi:hypothetical protein
MSNGPSSPTLREATLQELYAEIFRRHSGMTLIINKAPWSDHPGIAHPVLNKKKRKALGLDRLIRRPV